MMNKQKKKHISLKFQKDNAKTAKSFLVGKLEKTYFPYKPYPEQQELVEMIQQSIINEKNSLIESPTGTGKTLCLLVGAVSGLMQTDSKRSKIFYLTRTHSQINQVISEIKKLSYKFNVNIIGSRQQMCINKNLSELKGRILDKACEDLCNQKLCKYRQFQQILIDGVLDVNQYKEMGKKNFFCPYYMSKQLTQKSEITILPFNYLLDLNLFQKNSLNIKDSVLIFDEAHNIDSIAEQGASISLSDKDIQQALQEIKNLIKNVSSKFLHKKFAQSSQLSAKLQQMKDFLQSFLSKFRHLQQQNFSIRSEIIQNIQRITTWKDRETNCQNEGIDLGNCHQFFGQWDKVIKEFAKKQVICENFQKFYYFFSRMFQILAEQERVQRFSVYITENPQKTLMFQCLNSGQSFSKIVELKPRAIILSSGTLSPLNNWDTDLGISFPNKISVQSFITKSQLITSVFSRSQKGTLYDFSYQGKHNESQYEELVQTLKQLEDIINGGILVAFSNYQIMQKTIKHCLKLKKPVFYEKKNCNIQIAYQEFAQACKNKGGILFIIMRGRFSEGINFSHQLCRCLLVVGVPFLPLKDRKVCEKKIYLEKKRGKQDAQQWYMAQTIRALNQTIGRVIRSKDDYGIILLFDQKFEKLQIKTHLPNWFKQCMIDVSQVSLIQSINQFLHKKQWLDTQSQIREKSFTIKVSKQPCGKKLQQLIQFSTPGKTMLSGTKKLMIFDEKEEIITEPIKQKNEQQIILPISTIKYFIEEDQINNLNMDCQITNKQKMVFPREKKKKLIDSYFQNNL